MKNHYIKSKNLPENYFYVQKILNFQYEKRIRNYEENSNILFFHGGKFMETFDNNLNKTFETERLNTKNKFYTTNNNNNFNTNFNLNTNNNNFMGTILHNPYEDGKIHLFAKVMDIDIMVNLFKLKLYFLIYLE